MLVSHVPADYDMSKRKEHMKTTKEKGFTAVEGVIIVLILVVLGAAGWFVYKHQHKNNKATQTSANTTDNSSDNKKNDPYESWKTADIGTMASFKYPSQWTAQTNSDPSEQIVDLTAPSGWLIQLRVVKVDTTGSDGAWPATEPITILEQQAYLAYGSLKNDKNSINYVTVSTDKDKLKAHLPKLAKHPGQYFGMTTIFSGTANDALPTTLEKIKANADYAQVKLVLESVTEK